MAGQDDDHILQLINQNEERNRQAFNNSVSSSSHQLHPSQNYHPQQSFSNHHAATFNVAGRITSLVDLEILPSQMIQQSSQSANNNNLSLQTTGGMFNPATFNHQVAASNHHHQLKAASQAQPFMMQQHQQPQQQQQQNTTTNNNHDNNANNVNCVNPLSPNALAAYHHNQLAHSHMGHNNPQINHGHYTNVMNPNHHHQLLTGQIPLTNSMVPQTRLVGGTIPANDLSTLSNNLPVATSASVASFMSVNGQSNNFRPASSQTSSSTKKSSSSSTSKNGDSPRRTFACPTCGKGFTEKFNMKRHMQIHSQTRTKFMCNECSKSFAWKDNFIRHKKAAHGTNNSIQYQA